MARAATKVSRDGGGGDLAEGTDMPSGDFTLVGDPGDNVTEFNDDDTSWDQPNGGTGGTRQQTGRQPAARERTADEPGDEPDEEDLRLAYTEEEIADPQGQGTPGKRARRNAHRRQYRDYMVAENAELRGKVDQLAGIVQRLAQGQSAMSVTTLDGQISSLESSLRIADDEMAAAVKNSDGDTYAKALRIRDQIVGRLWGLKQDREKLSPGDEATQHQNGGTVEQPQQRQQQRQDPRITNAVANHFEAFSERFPWFDANSNDADCNIVRALDAELVGQGYLRHTPVFWQELERSMSRRYGLRAEAGGGEDESDERPQRRARVRDEDEDEQPVRRRPPTNNGRSNGGGGNRGGFTLSEAQTNILREEGLLPQQGQKLSDEDTAKRDRIINRWRQGAQQLRRGVQ
jgi:hypothetical protein